MPEKPSKAVTLNILDVAGNLQLTQGMIDEFVKQHPDVISQGDLLQGAGARAGRQDQGPAGRRTASTSTWC